MQSQVSILEAGGDLTQTEEEKAVWPQGHRDWSVITTSQGMLAITRSRKRQGTDSPRKNMALPTP